MFLYCDNELIFRNFEQKQPISVATHKAPIYGLLRGLIIFAVWDRNEWHIV